MQSVRLSWSLALALIALVSVPASAIDTPEGDRQAPISELMRQAAQSAPSPDAALAAARGRLTTSVRELEQFLAGGGADVASRWHEWLQLPLLKAELARPQPDVAALRSIALRYYQNQSGLELPAFVAVRRELRGLLTATEYAAADAPRELFRRRLSQLETCLGQLDAAPENEIAHQAGALVAWLEPLSEDAARLTAAVRAEYCRTNGSAQISGRFINFLLSQRVEQQTLISEFIFGSFTSGVAFTQGQVSFSVVPSEAYGTVGIRLQGLTTAPNTIAERRRLSVYSSSSTTLSANKALRINDFGFHLAPAAASAATSAQINDIEARRRLLERIAWRRATRMLPEVESLASRRAETEVGASLDRQAEDAFKGMNDMFCQQIRYPLIRLNALPSTLQFWSDHDHLRLTIVQQNDSQLAVATPTPAFPSSYDLALAFHESLVNNAAEAVLAGTVAKDEAWLNLMQILTGTSPRPLWVHDRAERWSVTFADQQPLIAQFDGNRIRFALHLKGVTRGQRQFEHPVAIEVEFLLTTTRDGPALSREGDPIVRFDGPVPAADEEQMRSFLTRKFGAVFPPELHFDGLVPPAGGTIGKLRGLEVAEYAASSGWLTLGYELTETPAAPEILARLP